MLSLIEPVFKDWLVDRPHLGCAMLIASCRENGIPVRLIQGQSYYLQKMFIDNSEELWHLLQGLNVVDLRNTGLSGFKEKFCGMSLHEFQGRLRSLYESVIVNKSPRWYFNFLPHQEMLAIHNAFLNIYSYHLVALKNNNLELVKSYLGEILSPNPQYVGFSLEGWFDPFTTLLRKEIKKKTGLPIIVGGSFTPYLNIRRLKQTFKKECFDYLVVGPGEVSLPALIERILDKNKPNGITNVIYEENGKIQSNPLTVIDNLDELPCPDFSDYDLDAFPVPKRILPFYSARGCSWRKCAFCSVHIVNRYTQRALSPDRFVELIRKLKENYSCNFFSLNQEEITPDQAKAISAKLLERGIKDIYMYAPSRMDSGFDNIELLRSMQEAGFAQLHWGLESGCQKILNAMKKGTKLKTMSSILKKSCKAGIGNICFFFFGFPGETCENAQQTIDFVTKHAGFINEISYSAFILEELSPISRAPEKWRVRTDGTGNLTQKDGMSPKETSYFYNKFLAQVKLNNIRVTREDFDFIPHSHNRVMAHLLASAFMPISRDKLLRSNSLDKIYPISLGEIKQSGGKTYFRPLNIDKSFHLNRHIPERKVAVNAEEVEFLKLLDGCRSINEIILTASCTKEKNQNATLARLKFNTFIKKAIADKWVIAFTRSWG